jgi:hypothetical protein
MLPDVASHRVREALWFVANHNYPTSPTAPVHLLPPPRILTDAASSRLSADHNCPTSPADHAAATRPPVLVADLAELWVVELTNTLRNRARCRRTRPGIGFEKRCGSQQTTTTQPHPSHACTYRRRHEILNHRGYPPTTTAQLRPPITRPPPTVLVVGESCRVVACSRPKLLENRGRHRRTRPGIGFEKRCGSQQTTTTQPRPPITPPPPPAVLVADLAELWVVLT